jgi:hypothetical protein
MMVDHVPTGHCLNSAKAEIIFIMLFKWENYIDKIFTGVSNVGNPFISLHNADHGFVRMEGNGADSL